jgi:hypothetical protein
MQTLLRVKLAMLAAIGIGVATLATVHAQAPAQAPTGGQPPTGAKAPPGSDNSSINAPKPVARAEEFTLTFSGAVSEGDCVEQAGATITLRSDGTAVWRSEVSSPHNDDAFCHNLRLLDQNGTVLHSWGRFCSFTLSSTPQVWAANLAFPAYVWPHVVRAQRDNHC